jgi:hypothetical protein
MSSVSYEWDSEQIDEHGDVIDHNFSDKLSGQCLDDFHPGRHEIEGNDLALVRLFRDEDWGVEDKEWAYPFKMNGKFLLPDYFDGGTKVPKFLHQEIARWQK